MDCAWRRVFSYFPSYVHGLILMSHTLCIQDIPDTAVAPLPHTGDTELTTPQENVADRDDTETTTVSSVHTIYSLVIYINYQDCACDCGEGYGGGSKYYYSYCQILPPKTLGYIHTCHV